MFNIRSHRLHEGPAEVQVMRGNRAQRVLWDGTSVVHNSFRFHEDPVWLHARWRLAKTMCPFEAHCGVRFPPRIGRSWPLGGIWLEFPIAQHGAQVFTRRFAVTAFRRGGIFQSLLQMYVNESWRHWNAPAAEEIGNHRRGNVELRAGASGAPVGAAPPRPDERAASSLPRARGF